MRSTKNPSAQAIVVMSTLMLTAFVIGVLYIGRELLVPLALAAMISFLLARLVDRIEPWLGRVVSVLLVVALLFGVIGGAGWLLTRQVIDLASKLPDYQSNIQTKLHSIQLPIGEKFTRLTNSVQQLRKDLPSSIRDTSDTAEPGIAVGTPTKEPVPVRVVESQSAVAHFLQSAATGALGPLGTAGLVLLLVVFMLLKREDLRGRLIRLVGQGRISATTRAMDDAGRRVARYLTMQFFVNICFGICVAGGLYFIGVPNAVLWGAFASIMRFVPYVGAWIAAAVPLLLSFAVSTSWWSPILVLALFIVLELINSNAVEPLLYGASTGVSPIALIVAAVFWTWMWGPIGLLLSTPLTVCLAVIGRHVPRLHFLSVLLSEEQALAPHEEQYHRLLGAGFDDASEFAETYAKANSLTALYDQVLIPALTLAEIDLKRDELDEEQHAEVQQNLRDVVEYMGNLPPTKSQVEADKAVAEHAPYPLSVVTGRVLCLPARAARDELAGEMLTQLLRQQGFDAENASAVLSSDELAALTAKFEPDALCISVVAPSTLIQARFLAAKFRQTFPNSKIAVGLWGATENLVSAGERLRASGANEVVVSLAEAVVHLAEFSGGVTDSMIPGPTPENEARRLAEVDRLKLANKAPDEFLDQLTKKIAHVFDVPIALVNVIDRDQQLFKSQFGLPEDMSRAGGSTRELSVCGHVVANNEALVVEDLARDRRFANNPLLKAHGLRFYAGAPLRSKNDLVIGSLCVLDTKTRRFGDHEKRLLQIFADEAMEEIEKRNSGERVTELTG
jgi:predicted PurR-regulated permease PerM